MTLDAELIHYRHLQDRATIAEHNCGIAGRNLAQAKRNQSTPEVIDAMTEHYDAAFWDALALAAAADDFRHELNEAGAQLY